MSLIFDLKQYYRIVACLSLALGLIALPVSDTWAKPGKADARTTKKKAKAKPQKSQAAKQAAKASTPAQLDPVTELEIISGDAITLTNALGIDPDDVTARQKLVELALRAARAAERALSRGDDDLFHAYRTQFQKHFGGTRPGLESMAGRGIAAADYALGALALHGMNEERNVERACARFAAALEKGFGGAKFRHAQCIEEDDPERAFALLKEAADSGHVGAIERLGRICLEATPPDAACAFARLERAARDGRVSARTLLGWMHAEGIGGKVDLARAAQYYREASQLGEPSAHNNLGELFESGRGVTRNDATAFEHYLAAANSGFPPGQFNVGRLYAAGKGCTQDMVAAKRWLGEAAKSGIVPAQGILDMLDQDTKK
jgi:TPR repeat protein